MLLGQQPQQNHRRGFLRAKGRLWSLYSGTLRMSLSGVHLLFSISPGQDDAQSLFGRHSTRASLEENNMSKDG